MKRIIIFGSSIRYDCDITSDLDICIDWMMDCYDENGVLLPFTKNMRKFISLETKGRADVVNYDYLENTVLEQAVKEGVVVYEYHVLQICCNVGAGKKCFGIVGRYHHRLGRK